MAENNVVSTSLRIGAQVTRLAGRAAGAAYKQLRARMAPESPQSAPAPPASAPARTSAPPPPAPPAPADPPAPSTPITKQAADVKTIDDSDPVVDSVAETGAEDGAGASVEIDAPWEGYDAMDAKSIAERLGSSDAALVGVVELYEQAHKNRKTVATAATRRLKALSQAQ